MANKAKIESNEKRKRMCRKTAGRRARLKAIQRDPNSTPQEKFEAAQKLDKLPRNGSPVRVRNRCSMTGRPRGYNRRTGLSRIALRELASRGELPGVTKSSW